MSAMPCFIMRVSSTVAVACVLLDPLQDSAFACRRFWSAAFLICLCLLHGLVSIWCWTNDVYGFLRRCVSGLRFGCGWRFVPILFYFVLCSIWSAIPVFYSGWSETFIDFVSLCLLVSNCYVSSKCCVSQVGCVMFFGKVLFV